MCRAATNTRQTVVLKADEEQRRANIDLADGTETAFQEERTRLMRTSLGHGGL